MLNDYECMFCGEQFNNAEMYVNHEFVCSLKPDSRAVCDDMPWDGANAE